MWYNQTQLKPKKMLCEKLAQIRVFFNFLFHNKRLFLYCASGFRTSIYRRRSLSRVFGVLLFHLHMLRIIFCASHALESAVAHSTLPEW